MKYKIQNRSPKIFHSCVPLTRETREGWPLVTVETEVNGDSKSTTKRGPFLGWLVGLVLPVQEIFVKPWLP